MPGIFLFFVFCAFFSIHASADTTITIGERESDSFGFYFNGVRSNPETAYFNFIGDGENLSLEVAGFDIDVEDELQVFLNGSSIGYMATSPNLDLSTSVFNIPTEIQENGMNTLEFRQGYSGWVWGVTDLLLLVSDTVSEPEPDNNLLQIDVLDTDTYGFRYNGVSAHRESVSFMFDSSGDDLNLEVSGFDIDVIDEVEVLVNGNQIGYLGVSPNLESIKSTLIIPAGDLISGSNTLEFRQRVPGWVWGISDILLINEDPTLSEGSEANLLQIGVADDGVYGFRYDGVSTNPKAAKFVFNSTGDDLSLGVTGFDIDTADEVQILVNGHPMSYLDISPNLGSSGSFFLIPSSVQVSGNNSLEFRQRNVGWVWGITEVLLDIVVEPETELSGYELVFNDEFNSPAGSSLDGSKWDTGLLWGPYFPINKEEQLYVDTLGMHSGFSHSPFELTGSTLRITATPTSEGLEPPIRPDEDDPSWQPRPYSEYRYNGPSSDGPGYQASNVNYLSGIITSYDSLKMTHGYVEMKAKLPAGRGLWPAFWLLNAHYVHDVPEIDVIEFLGQNTDRVYQTYHYFDISNNWEKISTPSFATYSSDWTDSFHTFGMAWGPTEIIWYIDGEETRRVSDSEYKIAGQAMYLLANLAVGGSWPGAPDETTAFPATFEIDYIRAYKRKLSTPLDLTEDYQLMFSDEFEGDSLNAEKWNTHLLWGPYLPINSEKQYYVDALGVDNPSAANSPFFQKDGILSITARPENHPDSYPIPQELPGSESNVWDAFPTFSRNLDYSAGSYTSGLITSYDSFKFAHGYAEIRAKIPEGDGLWPAFWLLNAYYVSQQPEIDVMEARGRDTTEIIHSYHRLENGLMRSDSAATRSGTPYSNDFHTYGVRWQAGKIDWYIDGAVVHSYENPDVGYQLMYVLANLAVGGNFDPGVEVDDAKLPASLDIDYIRVYQEKHKE